MRRTFRFAGLALLALLLLAGLLVGLVFARFTMNLQHIPADPSAGIHADAFVYIPSAARSKARRGESLYLLVQPNNIGSPDDSIEAHVDDAWWTAFGRHFLAEDLGVALLVPAFLRPMSDWQVYTHALDRESLTTQRADIARTDLQLLAMVDRLRRDLQADGIPLAPRFLIQGYSASGMFANRFTFLHPDRILAVAAGSPGGWPLAPVADDAGVALPYPAGIADLQTLTGRPVDLAALARVPQLIVMGDMDDNDSLDFKDGWDPAAAARVERLYGDTPLKRWNAAKRLYASAGLDARFLLVPGVGHDRKALQAHSTGFFRQVLEKQRKGARD